MSFIWPGMLALLLAAPLLVAAYLALVRRRAQRAAALAEQGFVPTTSARRRRRLLHVPFAFFLIGLVLLLVAFARPEMALSLPRQEGTVILTFDVSNSMRAEDLQPTRIDAAKAAARTFVEAQPETIEIGVVAFSDGGLVIQQPTSVRSEVLGAIERLAPLGATSLGHGIFTSLNAIAGEPITLDPAALEADVENLDIGYFGSAVVVLLSDGENTSNPDPMVVAELAAVAGVNVYPIGIGSTEGTVLEIDGFSVATRLDEDLLNGIATVTGGTYFHAEDAESLREIYDTIDLKLTSEAEKTEVTGAVTGISVLLLVVGGVLSLLWFGRLV
ncbi:MAG TPA: VWA domain-containing protein [Acidimicrobiales bacterium]|nr:VWA domain-containing protein [Acidimicrobiales bacterium]